MGARHVERQVRVDPVLYTKYEESTGNTRFYGQTPEFATLDSDTLWQIKMITYEGGVEVVRFANHGKFNASWDDRAAYFSSTLPIAGPDFPTETISVSNKPGLSGPAVYKTVAVNQTTWTAIPVETSQQVVNIYNNTGEELKTRFDNSGAYVGTPIPDQSQKAYQVQSTVIIYIKSESSVVSVDVEIISG